MIRRASRRMAAALAVAAVLEAAGATRAQNATTGTLGGVVRDAQLGVLPGASVVAVHAPTGTRYETFTRADGRFDLLNAQVGPYDLEIALSGFGTRALPGVVVSLGEATEVAVTLQLATVTETVEVTAEASAVFSPARSGTTASVESGVIETLPTLERSLQDFARTNPFFVKTSRNADSESFLSVAGRSGRYNNIQIDGAVNNDLFGLARQGTPGGQANTEPISLDNLLQISGNRLGEIMAGWMQWHHESAELHAIASLIDLVPTRRRQRTASAKCRQSSRATREWTSGRGLGRIAQRAGVDGQLLRRIH